jgi:hypothetical protein
VKSEFDGCDLANTTTWGWAYQDEASFHLGFLDRFRFDKRWNWNRFVYATHSCLDLTWARTNRGLHVVVCNVMHLQLEGNRNCFITRVLLLMHSPHSVIN